TLQLSHMLSQQQTANGGGSIQPVVNAVLGTGSGTSTARAPVPGSANNGAGGQSSCNEYCPGLSGGGFQSAGYVPWQLTIGNEAHQLLLSEALSHPNFFGNTWTSPDGNTSFGGRPDLGNALLQNIWELKPMWLSLEASIQVQYYSYISSFSVFPYTPAPNAPSFFSGNSLSLIGASAMYNYTFLGQGVIGYTYQRFQSQQAPGLQTGPGSIPVLPPTFVPI
ncbi:hypothetical protein, partial [Aliidongia dinghuensis]|uniref:hypothetical protein n=1 Tax=Aliidongia dinghuensis TaxID=1867774 RepID=UPI001E30DFB0